MRQDRRGPSGPSASFSPEAGVLPLWPAAAGRPWTWRPGYQEEASGTWGQTSVSGRVGRRPG